MWSIVRLKKITQCLDIKQKLVETCMPFVVERTLNLLQETGKLGVIIPVASVCTDGYLPLQRVLKSAGNLVISSYNDRPSKLFDGLEHIRLSIILCLKTEQASHTIFTTKYNKWQNIERSQLFHRITYISVDGFIREESIPKLWSPLERSLLGKVLTQVKTLAFYAQKTSEHCIYYTRKLSGFVQILDFIPIIYDADGYERKPSELKTIAFASEKIRDIFLALLNSNLFYWSLTIFSDCRNLNKREIYTVSFDIEKASSETVELLSGLSQRLMHDINLHSQMLEMKYENLGKMTIQCIYPKLSKPIIDEIDLVLAQHYGFSDEELDFIINYDIKYRMGRDSGENDEE